ncbi:MAG TPA: hypothetical protein DCS29_04640 [Candidatus Magasanikbacteria bacterium]|nr:MAG: hypothetical protein A2479_03980 [Candidatus Magasanikbacteria bacterium RIFOXYC2_FULL_39_8]HAT04028.1 hypothetical protein [Candidatus Magasanikbacteria bacterium]
MPIPQLNKRSYGYIGNQNTKKRSFFKKNRPNSSKKGSWTKVLKKTRGTIRRHNLKKPILIGGLTLFVFGFLFTTVLFAWASKDLPDPDKLTDRQIAQSTKIYDKTGEHLLYEIFADERRTIVELDNVPQQVIDGVIATEDTTFYEHHGIRPFSILRSILVGLFTNKRVGSGASTLTQQLVKNAILTTERSYVRKLKEVILTFRLEQKYTKDQILKIYFNEIPYGSTNYGIESAAQSYFGKHVSDLTLAESATLAGLPKAPSRYLNDTDALKARRDFVLLRMYEEGYIQEDEKNNAQAEPLEIKQHFNDIQAPHFVLYVKEQLVEKYGEALVETGGLKVITSLDWDKQQIAESVITKEDGKEILDGAEADNAALVAIDPKTGHILAMVGSRNFFDEEIDGQFNVATLGKRQPGSSFKPIVYAAAFEKGYTPDTILYDVLTNFAVSGKPYTPQNYDLKEYGPLSMRKALQGSLNIPAVKTMYLVGEKNTIDFAERLGYTTLGQGEFGLTLVLGGGEVKLIDHTNAYASFANNGIQYSPISVLKVEDSNGKVLEEWKKEKGNRVLEPELAATMSNVLSDDAARAYTFGANGPLTLPGRPLAVKTGTTNNYIDAWTVGYTPSLVTGIWVGNTNNTPMKQGATGSMVAAKLWNLFMRDTLENTPVETFPAPPPNTAEKPILKGSAEGGITLLVDKVTGKIATSSTPEKYIEEKTFIQPHSILHYVQKDDPRGNAPEHPEDDPQYIGWEKGIQEWIERKKAEDPEWNMSFEDPPTEYDDMHSLELIPNLEIIYPTEGQVLTSRHISTDIQVTAPRGVTKVTYRIDGAYVDIVRTHPFNLNYDANNLDPGEHTLTVTVEDDVGNKLDQDIHFILDANPIPAGISFNGNYNNLSSDDFPLSIAFNHNKLNELEEVRLYYQKDSEESVLVSQTNNFSSLFNNQIILDWSNYPGAGNYTLIAQVVGLGGEVRESERIKIVIQ